MKCCGLFRHMGLVVSVIALCGLVMVPARALAVDVGVPSEKDETVYVYTAADGSVKSEEVSAIIKNPNGAVQLADSSNLSDIKGEKEKTYSGSGDSIVWNANGENVTYKGATSAEVPVSVYVTYTLDDQPITPEELAGKSGHVTIRYEFENHSVAAATVRGVSQTVYTPFTCVTALMFDGNDFKNVAVENGKVINDGDDVIAVGVTMPGLKQSLGPMAEDADVPDYFVVTADTACFELKSTMTIATAGIMSDLDTSSLGLDTLDDAGALTDAMGQLIDGSSKLSDGLDVLKDGICAVNEGAGALSVGVSGLSGGLYALTYGSNDAPGLQDAVDAADQLVNGMDQVSVGLQHIADADEGLPAASAALTGLALEYSNEAETVAAAQGELQALCSLEGAEELSHVSLDAVMEDAVTMAASVGQVAPGVQAASTGLQEASAMLAAIVTSAKSLPQGLTIAVDVAQQLYGGAAELETYTAQLEDATEQLAEGAQSAADGSKTLTQGMQTFNDEGVSMLVDKLQNDFGGTLDRMNALSDAAKAYSNFSGITEGTSGTVKFVFETEAIRKP